MTTGTYRPTRPPLVALHAGPGFVLLNAWDADSARILEQVGFPAIATTSAGIAWSCGVPDERADRTDARITNHNTRAGSWPLSARLDRDPHGRRRLSADTVRYADSQDMATAL